VALEVRTGPTIPAATWMTCASADGEVDDMHGCCDEVSDLCWRRGEVGDFRGRRRASAARQACPGAAAAGRARARGRGGRTLLLPAVLAVAPCPDVADVHRMCGLLRYTRLCALMCVYSRVRRFVRFLHPNFFLLFCHCFELLFFHA
jgi:hypothetical protein